MEIPSNLLESVAGMFSLLVFIETFSLSALFLTLYLTSLLKGHDADKRP